MTNEEIIEEYGKPENWISLSDLLDLARQDEREKMTEEQIANQVVVPVKIFDQNVSR